ncbi:MAG: 16S rRNA (uracil(1498)-N(3))-methyltransferase [Methylocystis sp.]|nr:16S rRNA (uracil(1498)-N(3))-methyltransferase [Methylocystis sp.]MBI3275258.1 16S rRNA (uracil(1498)-N(3))-methyltransferase [Methylocystis sp.]
MSRYDFAAQRLFVEASLEAGARLTPSSDQRNYLLNVLRLREGDGVLLFNGRDGEWRAVLEKVARRAATLVAQVQTREQDHPFDLDYCFAPLKRARLDYMVQKAAEMGVARLSPVVTHRTQVQRVNLARLRANAIEAAEQCGILSVPQVVEETDLPNFLRSLASTRLLVFCDENAETEDAIAALRAAPAHDGVSLLVGPEGGFDDAERQAILRLTNVVRLSLGPRILRADTAAVAALALIQAVIGDWRKDPS